MAEEKVTHESLVCPECGVDMNNLDPEGHSLSHYPEYLDPAKTSVTARNHQRLILAGGVPKSAYLAAKAKDG